ncbi:MAG: FAD-containing oxidoreductase [Gemmatimonas sp.]|nr:FAD-containing oxidoreductase [Gemmatimonas sp.]
MGSRPEVSAETPDVEAPFEALLPWDEHNRRLATNVHPVSWSNPIPGGRYHLVVIGAGTGGLVTAAIAVALGARVALIERKLMGGDCLNVGCVPSKAVIGAARAWEASARGERFGSNAPTHSGDFAVAMERMRRLRADISEHDSAERFRSLGADVYLGQAGFTGPDTLQVGGMTTLRFRRAVIATGTRPIIPPIRGLLAGGYRTNETIFSLTEPPPRLAVVGGGPIGCELAQAFAAFGSDVTLLELGDRILPADDPEAAAVVARGLERSGVTIVRNATIDAAGQEAGERVLEGNCNGEPFSIPFDEVLVAAGRAPNIEGLDLDAAEVRFGANGVEVDDRLRTSNPRVFAIGDVVSSLRFTHVADAHARMVVRNALFYGREKVSRLVVPWCTYATPELARVGIRHEEVVRRGAEVDTVTVPFSDVDRARLDGDDDGFLRVYLAKGSDRILGATVVGQQAGELITMLTHAMKTGAGLSSFGDTIFPYPTRAEVVRKAADGWRRQKLTPAVQRTFDLFFRFFR